MQFGQAVLDREFKLLIDGKLIARAEDGATLTSVNPATLEALPAVPNAGKAELDKAVSAARKAFLMWRETELHERNDLVRKMAAIARPRADEFGMLDTLNTGNVYSAMRQDSIGGAEVMEYLASAAHGLGGEITQLDRNLHYTRREPYGVVLRLLPVNHPIASLVTGITAPLLTGNTVVVKPSPHSPHSALAFAEAVAELAPPGVVNILAGDNERLSMPAIRHPGINCIALTGSVAAGQEIMRAAADRLLPLTLELGGKNPLIVFPDMDVEQAVEMAIGGMNFLWQGHSCASTSRILVHRSLERRFNDRLAERLSQIKVALPTDEDAEMGAISFQTLYDRCVEYIRCGSVQGARLMVGGTRPNDPRLERGLFLTPALFTNVQPELNIAREEIFGPVIASIAWDDYETMIGIANELPFGLTAVLATNDLGVAHRTAERLEVGYVEVNGPVSFALGSAFGGYKLSGIGREGGFCELLEFTQVKSINIRLPSAKDLEARLRRNPRIA
jgi:acyl-CoA reductase-like NAD-dependent aldehyde dehydrogenase